MILGVLGAMVVAMGSALWRHIGSTDYGPPFAASSMLLFLLSFTRSHDLGAPAGTLLGVAIGGGMGLLIQMALWPVRPQHPLRFLVGETWSAASDYFGTLKPDVDPATITRAESALQTNLDRARKVLSGATAGHSEALSNRLTRLNTCAARLAIRVGAIHTAMVGLRGTETYHQLLPALVPNLTALVNTSRSIAIAVVSRQPGHFALCEVRLRRLTSLVKALQGRVRTIDTPPAQVIGPLLAQVEGMIPDISEALRVTLDRAGERALFRMELTDLHTWQLRPLAAALNLRSTIDPALLLFGVRMAVFCGLATFLYLALGLPHGYWLPFTLVVVMQPDYGSTRQKARQRVGGTLAGGVAASLLLWMTSSPTAHLVLIGISVFAFAYLLKRHYGIAVIFVTIFVVFLMEHSGQQPVEVEFERIGATLLGGLLALMAAQIFWPVRERDLFHAAFEKSLRATLAFLALIETRLTAGRGLDDEIIHAKRSAERAASQLFSSLARLYSDPRTPRAEVERLAALANGTQRILQLGKLLFVNLHENFRTEGETPKAYFSMLMGNLAYLAAHTSGELRPEPAELNARMSQLDRLPPPPREMPAHNHLVVEHLAQAIVELRAILIAAQSGTSELEPSQNLSFSGSPVNS